MKLNISRTVRIGLAFASVLAFWQFYDQVVPYLLEFRFGKSTLLTNIIMSLDNILALFMLPLFGALSDRTHTKMGKRTPYILFGTLAAGVLLAVMAVAVARESFPLFIVSVILLLVCMGVYRTPCVAYMPDVTPKPLRSKANAIINLVGYVGGIFATVAMMFLLKSEKDADGRSLYAADQSFTPIFIAVTAFVVVFGLATVFSLKENRLPHVTDEPEEKTAGGKLTAGAKKSLIFLLLSVFLWYAAYNGVTTNLSRYCAEVWNSDLSESSGYLLVATVAAIAAFLPLGLLSSRVGRKKTVIVGVAMMAFGYGASFFLTAKTVLMYPLFALIGIGWAAINVNSFPMVVELSSGADVGKYTGIYYTFSMAAQIFTPIFSGWLIDLTGYRSMFPYVTALMVLAAVTMCFVRHGDSKPEKEAAILEQLAGEDG